MDERQAARIGARMKAARERADLTQQELAAALGFEHRQTLASIEAGERRLTATDLVRAVGVLGVDLDYFTDSFRLVGEGRFSFRTSGAVAAGVLDRFEERAGRWIATYRELSVQQGAEPSWLERKLALTWRSSFEEAQAAAEEIVRRWGLGDRPADMIQSAVEQRLDALVLYVDAPVGISGAASQVPGLNAVLVNRNEPEGRRNYDLAHEVFHLLTWDAMPPERVETLEEPRQGKVRRIEQLADSFAAALLMPAAVMRARWAARDATADIHQWLNESAVDQRVSAVACKWRLHNLGMLSKADLSEIDDARLVANGRPADSAPPPLPFSAQFMRRIAAALDAGRLSVKRAASLLELTLDELAAVLRGYGMEPSFEP